MTDHLGTEIFAGRDVVGEGAIHASGLRYHKEKVFHDRPARVTGVIVNGEQLAAPNRQLKKIATLRRRSGLRIGAASEVPTRAAPPQARRPAGQIGQIPLRCAVDHRRRSGPPPLGHQSYLARPN